MAITTTPPTTYQSFTAEMQVAAMEMGVGLFGIPLGTSFLTEVANYMTQTQGATVSSLYSAVLSSSIGQMAGYYPPYQTDAQFAAKLCAMMLPSSITAANVTMAQDALMSLLGSGQSRAQVAKFAVDYISALPSTDATYGAAAAAFDNKVSVANYYTLTKSLGSTDITTLQNTLSNVTSDTATVTTAQSAIDGSSIAASAKTVTLTTSADIVGTAASIASALQVSNFDDLIVGYAASTTASTLGNADSIDGGAGTDTLRITAENTARISPIGSSIEVVELFGVSNETAAIGLSNLVGVTALTIKGTSDVDVNGLANGLNITLNNGYTKTAVLTMKSETTADSVTLNVGDASSAGLKDGQASTASGIEIVNLVATAAFANDSVFDFNNATALNISGAGNVTLNFQSGTGNHGFTATGLATGAAVGKLGKISGSAMAGNLTLYISTAGIDQSITGGAGNDTFYASGGFNQSDVLDGGAGTDALTMAVNNTGTLRPVITSVETLTVDFNADAVIDLRNSTAAGITTLNALGLATASTFSALGSAVKTINVMSGASAGGLTFNYTTGAPSDVVINLTNQTSSTSTASYNMGDLTVGNNTGGLTLDVVGTATGQAIDAFAANNVNALTVNVTSGQFLASAMNANAATVVTLNVNKTANITGNASFTSSTALNIVATGASAAVDFANIAMGAKGNLSVTLGSASTSLSLNLNALNWGATASTASMSNTVTIINQGDGDVVFSALDLTTAGATAATADQVTFAMSVTQSGAGASFASTAMDFGDIGTASISFTFAGQGSFDIKAAATAMTAVATAQFVINATGLNTAGTLSANFTSIVDTNATFDVRLGENSAIIALGAGADQVQFGNGAGQFVRGGAGNDQITMSTTAVSIAQYNNTASAAADSGTDTIFGASTGDIILFQGYNTSSAVMMTAASINTGTTAVVATAGSTAAQMASATLVGGSAVTNFFAMYTAAGDMILEVLLSSAGSTATITTAEITTITFNGKGDIGKSALLRVDTNGSGLTFTLL